jgi:hypothetical protein
LPFKSSQHDEGSSALHFAAGTMAALLAGFYLCFQWRSSWCYLHMPETGQAGEEEKLAAVTSFSL